MIKLCKDCIHSKQQQFQLVCTSVDTTDLVYRLLKVCAVERHNGTKCGTVGFMFKAKQGSK